MDTTAHEDGSHHKLTDRPEFHRRRDSAVGRSAKREPARSRRRGESTLAARCCAADRGRREEGPLQTRREGREDSDTQQMIHRPPQRRRPSARRTKASHREVQAVSRYPRRERNPLLRNTEPRCHRTAQHRQHGDVRHGHSGCGRPARRQRARGCRSKERFPAMH